MTDGEQKVRSQIRKTFDTSVEECMEAIYAYLFEFDEIHTLVDTKRLNVRLQSICEAQARKVCDVIVDYLSTLCPEHPSLVNDPTYPILQTLIDNHARVANQIRTKTQQGKAQGKANDEIAVYVRDYMMRAFKHSSDIVLFYETTRVTTDAVLAEAPENAYFRTVCEHDDRTCRICLDIEAEQASHPVPISAKVTGVNAPPFHPYCRCHVEVVQ